MRIEMQTKAVYKVNSPIGKPLGDVRGVVALMPIVIFYRQDTKLSFRRYRYGWINFNDQRFTCRN